MAADTRPFLREVMNLPEAVSTSDYVLKLAEAVTPEGAQKALADYVVTERLLENYDEALGLIKSALDGHTSKAAYLHGSFGSGKSHFMAVLYALLSGSPAARAKSEFDPLLTRHEWLGEGGKKFLLVPFHMLGAKSTEQRVLGGYVNHVQRLHPEASTPRVYRTDALFDDIRAQRTLLGTEAFLAAIGKGSGSGTVSKWGKAFTWTPELLDTALAAPEVHESSVPLDLKNPTTPAELRAKLVQDASATLFPGFTRNAGENADGFVSLDAGLSVIAEHARELGYEGLILFLDELILWLATLIQDQKLVATEAGKITNFVEGGDARRAIPVVSFIARQRDLRDLVGERMSGAAETSVQDTLNLASGRFDKITLEDRNLPQIAHARLLHAKDSDAQRQIDDSFARTRKVRQEVWDTWLGSEKGTTGADEDSFRLSYPFAPAFMDTLVHISNALQRNRTGMKLMGELLAEHRDELRLGDVVPLGDLYPLIARGGDKPFTEGTAVIFSAADKLYKTKLRPYLLATHDVNEDQVARYLRRPDAVDDAMLATRCRAFVGDDRITTTLLLSALVPSVPALNELTLRRLVSLNYGSVLAPIPGTEAAILKKKLEDWSSRFPEIKLTGTEPNLGVRLELSDIDLDSVLQNADVNNNMGNREALAKRLLREEFGLQPGPGEDDELHFTWRGSQRVAETVFGNIADADTLPDHALIPQIEGRWKIVIDLPWDEGTYGPRDDANRLAKLRGKQGTPSRTAGWIPTHLSAKAYKDFQRLVVVDKALADEHRFNSVYAIHLNADNRARAKALLESQRENLTKQVKAAFKQAYGLAAKDPGSVEVGYDEHLLALPQVENLTLPMGDSLPGGIRHVAQQLLSHQYPAHPDFDPDNTGTIVKAADAKKVFQHVRAAAEARDGRVEIPAPDRKVMQRIAVPLALGQQKEAYFELSRRWAEFFQGEAKKDGVTGDLSFIQLSDWTDRPDPRGLDPVLAQLVVASFAEMDDRVWTRGGSVVDQPLEFAAKPGDGLRSQPLPSEDAWEEARRRFQVIFGQTPPSLLRGRMVNQFALLIEGAAHRLTEDAGELVRQLERHATWFQLDETDEAGRLALARRAVELLSALTGDAGGHRTGGAGGAKRTVESLARFGLGSVSADRYGTSLKQAEKVASALNRASWDTLALADGLGMDGQQLLSSLRAVAQGDQRTGDLAQALKDTTAQVLALVRRNQQQATPPPPAVPVSPPPAAPPVGPGDISLAGDDANPPIPTSHPTAGTEPRRSGGGRTTAARAAAELSAEIAALAAAEPTARIELSWRVVED
ncbi:BREX-2 system ATPase PglY [Streptomyces scopuliridis]|uniref:BREX-2 system ATPase PglY n=1 Tax=Streptomyces scopuliridis TaxID=452529 RepID=UPI0035D954E2